MAIIPVNKPKGMFSRDIYRHIKDIKIGHYGTLDMNASGLLLVLTDHSNKLQDKFHTMEKTYFFSMVFGLDTDTNDIFGKIKNIQPIQNINHKKIHEYCDMIMNKLIKQRAPKMSAKKVKGVPMYKYMFNKQEHLLQDRFSEVYIKSIRALYISNHIVQFCSTTIGGFYVRSFVRDLSIYLGVCASVYDIARISIGSFNIIGSIIINKNNIT